MVVLGGPAGNTGRGWPRLRSGREHWAWILAVEVRQRTLGVDGRVWSRLRSDRGDEEQRRRGGGGEERRRGGAGN